MKKTVLTFGLISGAILSAMMLITVPFQEQIGWDRGEIIGYTTMVLASLLIFVGVRSYRDNVRGGTIGFGRAFAVGALIVAVSSVCYTMTWQVVRLKLAPDIQDKFIERMAENARAEGGSPAEVEKRLADLRDWAVMYEKPLFNVAMTFLEPLPVGLVVALMTAGIVRRTKRDDETVMAASAAAS